MNKINFVLHYENKLMKDFHSLYMPMNEHRPLDEIIQMFLEDEDYRIITSNEEEMKRKLITWADLYYENHDKKPHNYRQLKNKMKQFLRQYGYNNDDAIGFFVSEQIAEGIKEEDAYKIASSIKKEIIEDEQKLF